MTDETKAKPLTTAEVESWVRCGADLDGLDRILATTRELEELEEGVRLWHGTPPDERAMLAIDKAWELWRGAVERAEKAERERDAVAALLDDALVNSEAALIKANLFERHWGLAIRERDEARATMKRWESEQDQTMLGVIRQRDLANSFVAELVRERDTARFERDAARRELAELALEVGYGERPEGQGGIIHADGKTLAGAWLLERKGRDQAEADRDIARATVSELVGVLHAVVLDWDGADLGTVKAGLIDDARVILTKAFKEES